MTIVEAGSKNLFLSSLAGHAITEAARGDCGKFVGDETCFRRFENPPY
jgi:hypothetical protein